MFQGQADYYHFRLPMLDHCQFGLERNSGDASGLGESHCGELQRRKAAKRGPMPPPEHTYVAGKVALLVARLLALKLMDPTMTLIKAYGDDWKFTEFKRQIAEMNIYINEEGEFGRRPTEQDDGAGR